MLLSSKLKERRMRRKCIAVVLGSNTPWTSAECIMIAFRKLPEIFRLRMFDCLSVVIAEVQYAEK
jgi:hypothetical protein